MREQADQYDAELLLRLYELRREEKLRSARDWFVREFHAESLEEFYRRFPPGTPENAYFRMVVSYWDMVGSIVNHGLIKAEFFFENTMEFWVVWEKIKAMAPAWREKRKNPFVWKNLESMADKFEKWQATRAPEALDAFRQQVLGGPAKQ